jgi:hypothetical protein
VPDITSRAPIYANWRATGGRTPRSA